MPILIPWKKPLILSLLFPCAPDGAFFAVPGTDDAAMETAATLIREQASAGDIILVKASRGMALERVSALLEKPHA